MLLTWDSTGFWYRSPLVKFAVWGIHGQCSILKKLDPFGLKQLILLQQDSICPARQVSHQGDGKIIACRRSRRWAKNPGQIGENSELGETSRELWCAVSPCVSHAAHNSVSELLCAQFTRDVQNSQKHIIQQSLSNQYQLIISYNMTISNFMSDTSFPTFFMFKPTNQASNTASLLPSPVDGRRLRNISHRHHWRQPFLGRCRCWCVAGAGAGALPGGGALLVHWVHVLGTAGIFKWMFLFSKKWYVPSVVIHNIHSHTARCSLTHMDHWKTIGVMTHEASAPVTN